MDTGGGAHAEVDAHYRPRRRSLRTALADVGVRVEDVTLVVKLSPALRPLRRQPPTAGPRDLHPARRVGGRARGSDYTLPELVDAPGPRYEQLDGEAEVLPGVLLIPTPGYTAGHQSLVVRRADGTVVVAGQSHDTATGYSADALAWRAAHDRHEPLPLIPAWIDRLQRLDPARVVFAHDHALREP